MERAAPQCRLCLAHQVTQRELLFGSKCSRTGGLLLLLPYLYGTHSQGCPVHSNWEKVLEFRVR